MLILAMLVVFIIMALCKGRHEIWWPVGVFATWFVIYILIISISQRVVFPMNVADIVISISLTVWAGKIALRNGESE
jgi:hypothetical protein